jgi:hypothetical protein
MGNVIDHEVFKNVEWERKLLLKEDEIVALSEKLDPTLNIQNAGGAVSDGIYLELEKENDFLKIKIQNLSRIVPK